MNANLAIRYLREEVAPRASEIDRDAEALKTALDGMFDQGLMSLKVPKELGGGGLNETEFCEFQIEAARASGTFAFLQTQHQSAAGMLAKCPNAATIVPDMTYGRRRIGVGFSQLRRKGPPIMTATPCEGGFELNGLVPWVTGYSLYREFLIGATLPNGNGLFAVVPLNNQQGIEVGSPMRLAAMETAQTVQVRFQNYRILDSEVMMVQPPEFIPRNDMINIALQGHFAIGCALAAADSVKASGERRGLSFVVRTAESLYDEIADCRGALESAHEQPFEERLGLRAWVIELAVRCAHAAITAASGAANDINHASQRVYREALVFTVSAQTTEIMEATLDRLSSRRSFPPDGSIRQ